MPKNMGKGGKSYKSGKKSGETSASTRKELWLKEPGQEYGQVSKTLGNGFLEVYTADGKKHRGRIAGSIRRRQWICVGDVVLVGLRDYENNETSTVDIINKYTPEETKRLVKDRHIPVSLVPQEEQGRQQRAVDFVAEGDGSEEESSEEGDSDDEEGSGDSDDDERAPRVAAQQEPDFGDEAPPEYVHVPHHGANAKGAKKPAADDEARPNIDDI